MPKQLGGKTLGGRPVQRFYPRKIQELERELETKGQEYEALSSVNMTLRSKERVLLETIVTLSPNVHYSALAALEVDRDDNAEAQLAAAVGQDLQIYALMHQITNTDAATEDTYTARCLRAAVTPERIKATRTASFEEHMETFSNMVMRISFMLTRQQHIQQRTAGAVKFAMSIEEAVDRYTEHIMLCSMVSFKMMQRSCLYNLDTMQQCKMPAHHWEHVMEAMQLRKDQMELISALYARYIAKIRPMWDKTQQLAGQVRALLAEVDAHGSCDVGCVGSSGSNGQDPAAAAAALPGCRPGLDLYTQAVASAAGGDCGSNGSSGLANNNNGESDAAGGVEGVIKKEAQKSHANNSSHNSRRKHWQQFGLATIGLDFEAAEKLQQLLLEMDGWFNSMSQQSHALTFPAWNTFDHMQLARMVVAAYPWMPNICQICERVWWVMDPDAPAPPKKK